MKDTAAAVDERVEIKVVGKSGQISLGNGAFMASAGTASDTCAGWRRVPLTTCSTRRRITMTT